MKSSISRSAAWLFTTPPFCTPRYARALRFVEATLHHCESGRRSELTIRNEERQKLRDGLERRSNGGENSRRNYAIAPVCIRHSHSIVPGGFEVTS